MFLQMDKVLISLQHGCELFEQLFASPLERYKYLSICRNIHRSLSDASALQEPPSAAHMSRGHRTVFVGPPYAVFPTCP